MANPKPTVCDGDTEQALELLDAAITLEQPHRTAARALTVQTTLQAAVVHPGRRAWALGRLRQLDADWRAD